MRIEYDTDPAIVIVVNGPVLSYYDIELEEISNLRTNTTPASLLTRKNISFLAKDIEIIDIEKNQNYIKLTIAKKNNKDSGNFSLLFNLDPIEFLQMEVKNDLDDLIILIECRETLCPKTRISLSRLSGAALLPRAGWRPTSPISSMLRVWLAWNLGNDGLAVGAGS